MAQALRILATPRTVVGKANRHLARQGLVPAVLYGHGRESLPLSVNRHDFEQMLAHGGGTTVIALSIDGEKTPVDVIVREIQTATVKGTLQHVDFYAVNMDEVLHAAVTLRYLGEDISAGVKAGGVLMHNLREVNVQALPKDLPDRIDADITTLEINHSLHVGELPVPQGVTILDDPKTIVCSITAPKVEVEAEVEEEVEVEPEVIGEKPEAEEA